MEKRPLHTNFGFKTLKNACCLCIFVFMEVSAVNSDSLAKILEEECNNKSKESLNGKECDFPEDYDDGRDGGLRKGAIIGIVVGSLALATALGILCCYCLGIGCFKKHFYRKNKTEVLSATVRSHQRSHRHPDRSLHQVPPNNEAKIVIEPMPTPHFIATRQNPDQNPPGNGQIITSGQNRPPTASSSHYRRPSEDNSAYWGGYEDSVNGENIYSEPEYANESSIPPSYYTNDGNPRQIAVIDGTIFHQGMYNQSPSAYSFEEGNANRAFIASEQPQSFGAPSAPTQTDSKFKLTEL